VLAGKKFSFIFSANQSYSKRLDVLYVAESNTRQMDRSMRDNVRRSGKRPREAYSDGFVSVEKIQRVYQTGRNLAGDVDVL